MRRLTRIAVLAAVPVLGVAGVAAAAPGKAQRLVGLSAAATSAPTLCYYTGSSHAALAKKLSADIYAQVKKSSGAISVAVYDRKRNISCYYRSHVHYDSASTVKATILAALLRKRGGPTKLTATEKAEAKKMITQSDNDAATYLWNRVGRTSLNNFLKAASMNETTLGSGGYWGLTQETAFDELRLLKALTGHNTILSDASRSYQLGLMHQVISGQRWGTPAGVPSGVTWHVKNGWLPRSTHHWRVHSIGSFVGGGRDYMMAIMTQDDATLNAGVANIERVAKVVHRDLNSTAYGANALPTTAPEQIQQGPDEVLPPSLR